MLALEVVQQVITYCSLVSNYTLLVQASVLCFSSCSMDVYKISESIHADVFVSCCSYLYHPQIKHLKVT